MTKEIIIAIICITVLELMALYKGYNGTLLTTSIGVIAGLVGWITKTPKILQKKTNGE